jgi:hypothetical protein
VDPVDPDSDPDPEHCFPGNFNEVSKILKNHDTYDVEEKDETKQTSFE